MIDSSILGIIAAASGAVGMWLTARTGKKGDRERGLIDRLEKRLDEEIAERAGMQTQITSQQGQLEKLARQIARFLHRDMLWDFHTTRVEDQVSQLGGTPYPRPAGLEPISESQE